MKPIHPRQLIEQTARELNLPKEQVADIVNFYYHEVRDNLGNLKQQHLFLRGLGKFSVKPRRILIREKQFRKNLAKLRKFLSKERYTDWLLDVLKKIAAMKKIMAIEKREKGKVKTLRRKYEAKRDKERAQLNKDLAEQGQDNERDQEQPVQD